MSREVLLGAALAVLVGVAGMGWAAEGTVDDSFKASSRTCEGIEWEADVLERYPRIQQACQGVVERDGKTYVKFVGYAASVSDRAGGTLDIRFRGVDERMQLKVPSNMRFYVGDRSVSLAELAPRQDLTFYVPSDNFVAHFFDETAPSEQVQVAEIVETERPTRMAQAQPSEPQPAEALPQTASALPLLGVIGGALVALGAALRLIRRRRHY